MTSEIIESNIRLNSDGNQIINEIEDGAGKTQTIKYGMIKLIGDKKELRVSYKTFLDIDKAQKANFTGKINIPELNMSVFANQIVMMRSETETIRKDFDIINLPTTNVSLTLDFEITNHTRIYFMRNKIPHFEATVHYVERDGQRQYYLDVDKIKKLVKINIDEEGYDYVTAVYHYGVKQPL